MRAYPYLLRIESEEVNPGYDKIGGAPWLREDEDNYPRCPTCGLPSIFFAQLTDPRPEGFKRPVQVFVCAIDSYWARHIDYTLPAKVPRLTTFPEYRVVKWLLSPKVGPGNQFYSEGLFLQGISPWSSVIITYDLRTIELKDG